MPYGIRVSNEGETAFSLDETDISLDSQYPSRTIKMQGTVDLTTNTSDTWAEETVTHNFGYYPQIDAYVELVDETTVTLPGFYTDFFDSGGTCTGLSHQAEQFRVKITDTTIVFGARYYTVCVIPMFGSVYDWLENTYTIKYKIYMEAVDLP